MLDCSFANIIHAKQDLSPLRPFVWPGLNLFLLSEGFGNVGQLGLVMAAVGFLGRRRRSVMAILLWRIVSAAKKK